MSRNELNMYENLYILNILSIHLNGENFPENVEYLGIYES